MKKAKLMLSAIAVLGVLGTSVAFSANKFSSKTIYTGTGGVCQTPVFPASIVPSGTPDALEVNASTASLPSNCPSTFTVAIDQDF